MEPGQSEISPRTKLKIILLQRKITASELADALGLSLNYIYRLSTGAVVTRTGRQKITDHLGEEIWPGIHPLNQPQIETS